MNKKFIKFLIAVIITVSIAFIINTFFVEIAFINGDSMLPDYKDGSVVFINKNYKKIDNGDVIVGKKNDIIFIKRVVAQENDRVVIKDGYLYINDQLIEKYGVIIEPGILSEEIVLSHDEYIVLGDNINSSIDSRNKQIGVISSKNIIGIVM